MKRTDIINKLSKELSIALGKQEDFELIKTYIQASMVSEIDRNYGYDLQIYQKIHPVSGLVIDEYWGFDEITKEIKQTNPNTKNKTIKTSILKTITGFQHIAYGYVWKKL